MKRLFNKLPGTQQGILLICIWAFLLVWGVRVLGEGRELYDNYNEQADLIRLANQKLSQLPAIEKAIRKRLKSHDRSLTARKLGSVTDSVAKQVDPGARYVDTSPKNLGELFSQHTVKITFNNTSWDSLKGFVSKIKEFQGMFLSEVNILADHGSGPDGPYLKDYRAIFHISSLELKKKKF